MRPINFQRSLPRKAKLRPEPERLPINLCLFNYGSGIGTCRWLGPLMAVWRRRLPPIRGHALIVMDGDHQSWVQCSTAEMLNTSAAWTGQVTPYIVETKTALQRRGGGTGSGA